MEVQAFSIVMATELDLAFQFDARERHPLRNLTACRSMAHNDFGDRQEHAVRPFSLLVRRKNANAIK